MPGREWNDMYVTLWILLVWDVKVLHNHFSSNNEVGGYT